MLRRLLRRKLASEEKKLGESVDYLRHVVDVSPTMFLRFAGVLPMANCRKAVPKEAWYTAQLVAVRHEDCGTCVQIAVNLARQDHVPAALVQDVLDDNLDALPAELVDVCRFTQGVINANGEDDQVRETLRARYGERGLVELAYAIATARIPPTVKRALGYAKSCSIVPVKVP